jgi:uncharacterized protein (UPF0332 family)
MRKYRDEIERNIQRTRTCLEAARKLLQEGHYDAVAAQASQAAFHTACALLLIDEIAPGREEDVVALVQQAFVEKRRLTKEQGEKLRWLLQLGKEEETEARVPLIQGEAEKALQFAESFLEAATVIRES